MTDPVVSPTQIPSRIKRWLLARRIEQHLSSNEPSGSDYQQPHGELVSEGTMTQDQLVAARGEIRREEVPLLAHYGTSYGLFEAWIADYECVLTSDTYRLGDYVGNSVWVSGPLTGVIDGMPVMKVTRLKLEKLRWMR